MSLGRIDMLVVNGSLRSSSSNSHSIYVCNVPNVLPADKKRNNEMLKRQNLVGESVTIWIIV